MHVHSARLNGAVPHRMPFTRPMDLSRCIPQYSAGSLPSSHDESLATSSVHVRGISASNPRVVASVSRKSATPCARDAPREQDSR
jgi:hypothetical protein